MKVEEKRINGYYVIYCPDNPNAMKDGYVYEHVLVAQKMLGRLLEENEVVHHLDFNRANNLPSNLQILEKGQHTKIHNWINNTPGLKDEIIKRAKKGHHVKRCLCCGEYLLENDKFCNRGCLAKYYEKKKSERPSKKDLECLLSYMNKVQIGKMFGVSRSTINVWLKDYVLA
jgi:hypothetical protein